MVLSASSAGAEMMTFFAPAAMCLEASTFLVKRPVLSTTTGGAGLAPLELGGIFFGADDDAFAVDDDGCVIGGDFAGIGSVDGIILEEMSEGFGGCQVIDGNDLDFSTLECGAKNKAPDAAEAVDTNFDCHEQEILSFYITIAY